MWSELLENGLWGRSSSSLSRELTPDVLEHLRSDETLLPLPTRSPTRDSPALPSLEHRRDALLLGPAPRALVLWRRGGGEGAKLSRFLLLPGLSASPAPNPA